MWNLISGAGKVFNTVVDFGKEHPIASTLMLNTVASAFAPDEIDILQEQDRLIRNREDDNRKRRERNMMVGGIDLGFKPSESKKFLSDSGTATDPLSIIQDNRKIQPAGLINTSMGDI